jgi:hypothetical protein
MKAAVFALAALVTMVSAAPASAVVSTTFWPPELYFTVSFDIAGDGPGGGTNHVTLQLTTDPFWAGIIGDSPDGFVGRPVEKVSGTDSNKTPIWGPDSSAFPGADNLFNPKAPYFDSSGLAFDDGALDIHWQDGALKVSDISGDVYDVSNFAAAPEASTWAMMLAGFAVLGFAGYRRGDDALG